MDIKTYTTIHAIARNTGGQFLILQRAKHRTNPGRWNFVTGYIKEKESAEEAALRELKEETNLSGEIVKTTEPWWIDHNNKRFIIVSSLIQIENEGNLKIDENESQSYQWVTPTNELVRDSSIMSEGLRRLQIINH